MDRNPEKNGLVQNYVTRIGQTVYDEKRSQPTHHATLAEMADANEMVPRQIYDLINPMR